MIRLNPQPSNSPALGAVCTSKWSDRYHAVWPHTLRFAGWFQGPNDQVMIPRWDCACGRRNYDGRDIAVLPIDAAWFLVPPKKGRNDERTDNRDG